MIIGFDKSRSQKHKNNIKATKTLALRSLSSNNGIWARIQSCQPVQSPQKRQQASKGAISILACKFF